MSKDFYSAIKDRRSIYAIGKDVNISDDFIEEVIKYCVKYTPSAFNSQSARVVLLLGENHTKLWNIVMETLRKIVPAKAFSSTEEKINSFNNGYGTVLYFDETNIVKGLQEKFPTYKDNFPVWAEQANGMLQFAIWNALEIEGLGASIQHYNPIIDDEVKREFNISDSWKLIAQMPFGNILKNPDEKDFAPIEDRVLIIK